MKNTRLVIILAITAAIVILSLAAVILSLSVGGYLVSHRNEVVQPALVNTNPASGQPPATSAAAESENPFLQAAQSNPVPAAVPQDTWVERTISIILRLLLSVILAAILAFRPRKNVPLLQRNLYVAQTQILLAVVAAALMMIVGDNAARAFAIFAAVSLVRFRTNIRDPKEVTVLLISLALGLAAGVGHWDLGIALCLFSLVLLWFLEYNEPEQMFRSMGLTVKTHNTNVTHDVIKGVLDSYKIESEVRQIEPPENNEAVGCIVFYLNLRLSLSTDHLSEKILSLDAENIEGIQWEQKKDASYIYQ